VGANVGKGQNFGLTTPKPRIVFDETKLADAAFSFIHGVPTKVLKRDYGASHRWGGGSKGTIEKSHPSVPSDANESNTNAINEYNHHLHHHHHHLASARQGWTFVKKTTLPLHGSLPASARQAASNLPCPAGGLDPL